MRPFRIETRLDQSGYGYGNCRLTTRIQVQGQNEIGQTFEVGVMPGDPAWDYFLEKHFHDLKHYILNMPKDQLFKDSPEYQRMKRLLDEANGKLDYINDISDPNPRK